ncbi:MAG: hypothetical protein DRQ02_01300 [Candidatus Latescibacterota bacterium]|nr:MAG: hypothetical protein DRQ02_01300 [Candidatus Latescibacterota bacterium]
MFSQIAWGRILVDPAGLLAVGLFFVGLLILAFVGLMNWYKRLIKNGTHPVILETLRQVIVMIYKAKANEQMVDRVSKRLHGIDKALVARKSYWVVAGLLPERWQPSWLPISFPLKQWFQLYVSPQKWQSWIDAQWEELMAQWDDFDKFLDENMKLPEGDGSMKTPPKISQPAYLTGR